MGREFVQIGSVRFKRSNISAFGVSNTPAIQPLTTRSRLSGQRSFRFAPT
jgi:hypothetical protein